MTSPHHPLLSRIRLKSVVFVFPLISAIALAAPSFGQIVWQGGASGDFDKAANWSGESVPGEDEIVQIENAGAVTITFTADATFGQLNFAGTTDFGPPETPPTLQLNLDGFTVAVTAHNALNVFSTSHSGERTVIVNGGILNLGGSNNLQAGGTNVASTNAIIRLENGVAVDLGIGGSVQIGNSNSMGELQIVGGSTLNATRGGVIGRTNDAVGLVTVSGEGSSWLMTGKGDKQVLHVGGAAKGTLNIEHGATVFSSQVINVGKVNTTTGAPMTGDGTILVTGRGSSLSASELYIGGGRGDRTTAEVLADGRGLVTFQDGATGTFSALIRALATASIRGTLAINTEGGSQVAATTDATLDSGSLLSIGLSAVTADPALVVGGTLTLTGSTLEIFLPDSFTAKVGDSFKVADYGALVGTFANSTVTAGNYTFAIDYSFGENNQIAVIVTAP